MVASGEEQGKGGSKGKGFAGLSSLVSDVDTSSAPAAKKGPTDDASTSIDTGPWSSQAAQPKPQPSQRRTYQEPPQPSSGSSGGKWVLGIIAVIGVIWFISEANKKPSPSIPAPSPSNKYDDPFADLVPQRPQVQSRPEETRPPVGQSLVFSIGQIRYCLAEDTRIDGAKSALNNYSNSEVDRFNAMVDDYNSRCGSFRYRSGALESARRDIEPYRSQLQAEGRSRLR